MRVLLWWALVSTAAMAGEEAGPPPPWFDAADGVVLATIATTAPAKLRPGTLGACKRLVTYDSTVIHTCDVTGGTFSIGDPSTLAIQTIAITKTQVIEGKKSFDDGKPYLIYWFVGTATLPAGASARLIITKSEGSKQFQGNVQLMNLGSSSGVVLDVP